MNKKKRSPLYLLNLYRVLCDNLGSTRAKWSLRVVVVKNDLITLSEALNMSNQTALSSHGPFIDFKALSLIIGVTDHGMEKALKNFDY